MNKVFSTSEYSKFSFFKTNQPIKQTRVKRLAESMKEHGFIFNRPILVTTDFKIIDGQHRFEAAKLLGLDVWYTLHNEETDGDPEKLMIDLNLTQSAWGLRERLNYWSNKGVACYKRFQEIEKESPLTFTPLLNIIFGATSTVRPFVKKGASMPINPEYDRITTFLIKYCKPFLSFYTHRYFVRAVNITFDKVDDPKLRNKLANKIGSIKKQGTIKDYLQLFENIINKGRRSDLHISL